MSGGEAVAVIRGDSSWWPVSRPKKNVTQVRQRRQPTQGRKFLEEWKKLLTRSGFALKLWEDFDESQAVPLQHLTPYSDLEPLPAVVSLFIEEAVRRVEQFQHERCIPGFVPSHFPTDFRTLKVLAGCSHLRGRRFCEWGSGFGVVTCLAAMLNYEAVGIEQEPELVELARKLAEDFGVPVSYVCGSFLPDETQTSTDGEMSAYDFLGFAPEELDVIFAYPWPDERTQTVELFEEISGAGSIFVMFHGGEEVSVMKKIKSKKGK